MRWYIIDIILKLIIWRYWCCLDQFVFKYWRIVKISMGQFWIWYEGGSLDSKLWKFGRFGDDKIQIPTWKERLLWLRDSSEAMVYLHDMRNVIHRDLKSQNVLLSYDFKEWFDHPGRPKRIRAKVSDFNTSKFCDSLGVARKSRGIVRLVFSIDRHTSSLAHSNRIVTCTYM